MRETWSYSVQMDGYQWEREPGELLLILDISGHLPCCILPFCVGLVQRAAALTGGISCSLPKGAFPVAHECSWFKGMEEKHPFKPRAFTLRCEGPSCPFSHIQGGIRELIIKLSTSLFGSCSRSSRCPLLPLKWI